MLFPCNPKKALSSARTPCLSASPTSGLQYTCVLKLWAPHDPPRASETAWQLARARRASATATELAPGACGTPAGILPGVPAGTPAGVGVPLVCSLGRTFECGEGLMSSMVEGSRPSCPAMKSRLRYLVHCKRQQT